jgi:hypothetical protein
MRWAAAMIALAACAAAAPIPPPRPPIAAPIAPPPPLVEPPRPLDQDLPRLAGAVLALQQEVGRALAMPDCAGATGKLASLQPRYAEVIVAAGKVMRDGRAPELRRAVEPHQADFDAAARAIAQSPALASCAEDHGFAAALDGLGEPR